jgi:arsenite methyltransferase
MVRLYEEDVWGDSIHPGGMELTARMASSVEIGEHCTVLDVASGKGETALFLAREYGCRTVGVDLSMKMLSRARQRAIASSTPDLLAFLAVDAEMLPFSDQSFDVILCECSFSLLADQHAAAKEFYRVLHGGGRIGIADFYLISGTSPLDTGGPFLCLDGAVTEATYRALLSTNGFKMIHFKDETDALKALFLDLILTFGSINAFLERLPQTNCENTGAVHTYGEIKKALREGTIGYCIVSATK